MASTHLCVKGVYTHVCALFMFSILSPSDHFLIHMLELYCYVAYTKWIVPWYAIYYVKILASCKIYLMSMYYSGTSVTVWPSWSELCMDNVHPVSV